MTRNLTTVKQHFFRDQAGHVVIAQKPNCLAISWLIAALIAWLCRAGKLRQGFTLLSVSLLFCWAYQELTAGVNYFRRLLGLAVLSCLIVGYFVVT